MKYEIEYISNGIILRLSGFPQDNLAIICSTFEEALTRINLHRSNKVWYEKLEA